MTDINTGLFENFALKNWYRFLLYLGGVILILSLFLEPKGIDIHNMRAFSSYTIILFIIVWIIDDIIYKIVGFLEIENQDHPDRIINKAKTLSIFRYIISFVALLVWSSWLFNYLN